MIGAHVDVSDLTGFTQRLLTDLQTQADAAAKAVATGIYGHIQQSANQKLHSTREQYLRGLSFTQEDGVYVITLAADAEFIEEGLPPNFNMLTGLLNSPKAKTAQDGSKYINVPFTHNAPGNTRSIRQENLTNVLKTEFKNRGLAWGGLETEKNGQPKLGLVNSFDVLRSPTKTQNGPYQGHGPIGAVRQGHTGTPFLQGVRVYQKPTGPAGQVTKQVVTFRRASSKSEGKWLHPGLPPKHFFENAIEKTLAEFDRAFNANDRW